MTDTAGFPPFKNARPKERTTPVEQVSREAESPEVQEVLAQYEDKIYAARVQRINVCATCGSREVREAVLIGNEVYIKVS